ncbi:hypothetical protein OQA88_7535 [Cercophora sp. LCS_1]
MSSPKPAHLDPSALGTKQYWDDLYKTEITNHATNPADEGTVWFDDSDAEAKIVEFLSESSESGSQCDPSTAAVLDLGCGNGSLLYALRDEGWSGRLVGVDYSETSVALAKQVGKARGEDGSVEFMTWDAVNGEFDEDGVTEGGWNLVLDKGTFDAVSLCGEKDGEGRRVCEGYGGRVARLLKIRGRFLVTSCNWTETELGMWFEGKGAEGGKLRQVGRIKYPSFSFGGVKGQTISTLCFEKVA